MLGGILLIADGDAVKFHSFHIIVLINAGIQALCLRIRWAQAGLYYFHYIHILWVLLYRILCGMKRKSP